VETRYLEALKAKRGVKINGHVAIQETGNPPIEQLWLSRKTI
jgi:hypothetical protein